MPGYFFDSSALGKRYHAEVGTVHVEALFQAPQPSRFISRLSVVELQSVFAGKVRTRAITGADLELLRARFLQDIARREFRVIRMTDVHYREAERLMQQHGVRRSLRTLDALQLSVALARFCRKFRFWGKIRKSGINHSMTYRPPNSRKSNFATEPGRGP